MSDSQEPRNGMVNHAIIKKSKVNNKIEFWGVVWGVVTLHCQKKVDSCVHGPEVFE